MPKLFFLLFALSAWCAESGKSPGGWESFSALKAGNIRFSEGNALHPNQDSSRRTLVATGQHPLAIVVSCSDSRVPPETIFDQGLGDIFAVRLAGNVMSTEAIASIEYAVEHLGAHFLVLMGHESCGAVGAAVTSKRGVSNGSASLDVLVKQIRAGLTSAAVEAAATDPTFKMGVKENVGTSLRALVQRSEIVRHAIAKGDLLIGQAIYSLQSGQVEFWDVGKSTEAAESTDRPLLRDQKVLEEVILPDLPRKAIPKKKIHELAVPEH